MLIGAMNHPGAEVTREIEWMAAMGMDFIDLTLEPPRAAAWQIEPLQIRELLQQRKMGIVGHTAYYLPLASPFEDLRRTAVEACRRCIEAFAVLGARWMNVHPDTHAPLHGKQFLIDRNLQSLQEILQHAKAFGIGIMLENIPGSIFNSAGDLAIMLQTLPELGLHLDIGHANLSAIPRNAESILEAHGIRLRHVHLHDNKGGDQDLHMALGTGTMDIPGLVRTLKASGYNDTITLEVFSPDRHYLEYSRNLLRKMWDTD